MKKTSAKPPRRARRAAPHGADEIPTEIDFSRAIRNPYAARYATASNIVVLEPDVAASFPNSASVNEALRSLARVMARRKDTRPPRRRSA